MLHNPIVLLRANGGREVHLLIQRKYRHYGNAGSAKERFVVASEDDLDQEEMGRILEEVFGIKGVDLSRIYHRKEDDGDGSWIESVKDLDSSRNTSN